MPKNDSMIIFVGREFELNALNRMYKEDRFHFIPITGRHRVGKTRLIEEFIIQEACHILLGHPCDIQRARDPLGDRSDVGYRRGSRIPYAREAHHVRIRRKG